MAALVSVFAIVVLSLLITRFAVLVLWSPACRGRALASRRARR
jgi:hypothetical protein